jgi:hypothetical protein
LELAGDAWRRGCPDPDENAEKGEHDEDGSSTARDASSLQPVDSSGEHDAEQHTEEGQEHDGAAHPEQLERDVEPGDDSEGAQNVPRRPAPPLGCHIDPSLLEW